MITPAPIATAIRNDRTAFCGAAIVVALLMMGVLWWKALVVGLLVFWACDVDIAGRWLFRGSVVLLALGCGVWVELLPSATQLRGLVTSPAPAIIATSCATLGR